MSGMKSHKSCEECRRRKIRCVDDTNGSCKRCRAETIECTFTPQKTVGRPPKRRRQNDEDATTHNIEPPIIQDTFDFSSRKSQPLPTFDTWAMPSFETMTEQIHEDIFPPTDRLVGCLGGSFSDAFCDPLDTTAFAQIAPEPMSPISRYSWSDQSEDSSSMSSEAEEPGFQYQARQSPSLTLEEGPCNCLTKMYQAASQLETTRNSGFPVALVPIKAALTAGRDILLCPKCPKTLASSRQNVTLLMLLFGSIASGLQILFDDIDSETARALSTGDTKILDSGDMSATNAHLSAVIPDRRGRLVLELEPREWQVIVKRAVLKHAFQQRRGALCLEALVEALEARQRSWHKRMMPCHEKVALQWRVGAAGGQEYSCLRFTQGIRDMMHQFAVS